MLSNIVTYEMNITSDYFINQKIDTKDKKNQLNLLTLIQVSAILSGNQSGNQTGEPAWSVQS